MYVLCYSYACICICMYVHVCIRGVDQGRRQARQPGGRRLPLTLFPELLLKIMSYNLTICTYDIYIYIYIMHTYKYMYIYIYIICR